MSYDGNEPAFDREADAEPSAALEPGHVRDAAESRSNALELGTRVNAIDVEESRSNALELGSGGDELASTKDLESNAYVDALGPGALGVEYDAHVGAFASTRSSPEHPVDVVGVQAATRVSRSRYEHERIRADARSAMIGLGFRVGQAGTAVDLALQRLGEASLEDVIREALRSLHGRGSRG